MQSFDQVTVLFSDVIDFDEICQRLAAMNIVALLNVIFTRFDALTEKHHVYKVSDTTAPTARTVKRVAYTTDLCP